MSFQMILASFSWILLATGIFFKSKRRIHVPLMLSGITLDFSLVAYLQITKNAVDKVLNDSMDLLMLLHVGSSTIALILYLPVLYLGFSLLRRPRNLATVNIHKKVALTAFFFRTLGFILMFSMIDK
jgi:uncharacterized membrane protein YozB (DUF420 family)